MVNALLIMTVFARAASVSSTQWARLILRYHRISLVSVSGVCGASCIFTSAVWSKEGRCRAGVALPCHGLLPEEGRYYAVRAKPRQIVHKPHRLVPLVLAAMTYLFNSNAIAFQDMASLVPSADLGSHRWTAFVAKAPVGSVHQAEMPFVDATTVTGSIATNGIEVPGIGRVALSGGKRRPSSARTIRTRTKTASIAPTRRAASSR